MPFCVSPKMIAARRVALAVARRVALAVALAAALATILAPVSLSAQVVAPRQWNDSGTLDLVSRAVARRTAQLADTGLIDYRAVAHGYLTFFAQVGDGFPDPPKVVRADELAVEVYWRAPNRSKQHIIGRRDTLLLPTDIAYHRDHLAIVQNNFPAIIRLGDGDEVRDVPHPLSGLGGNAYDFALADSLAIRVAGRNWDVVMVEVRPRDDRLPRVVGAMYLDRATASVVRLNLTFTRAALIDPALEDVTVVLDNGLVDGRFWLPRRQEIEIRRTGSWLEFPARGIIRGEWDLCCVETNSGLPVERFAGAEISVAAPQELAAYRFPGLLADSIAGRVDGAGPGRAAETLQRRAGELIRASALRQATRASAAAQSVSDFVRVNRVEGLALGTGMILRLPASLRLRVDGRFGVDDALVKYRVALGAGGIRWPTLTLSVFDDYRDAGTVPEMSRLGNSIAAQEFGADFTDEYRVAGMGATLSLGQAWKLGIGQEEVRETPLAVHAAPFSGWYRPAFAADAGRASRTWVRLQGPPSLAPGGVRWRLSAEAARMRTVGESGSSFPRRRFVSRAAFDFTASHAAPRGTLDFRAVGASVSQGGPARQYQVHFGGPITAPGYLAHTLSAPTGWSSRLEWRARIGGYTVPLGRFGRTHVPIVIVPWVNGSWLSPAQSGGGELWRRSAGLGVITAHDLLRLDVARGVDPGGRWALYIDFGHGFWPIL